MLDSFKRLFIGLTLIALASGVLLYSDRHSRNRAGNHLQSRSAVERQLRLGFVQHASQVVLDDGARSWVRQLADELGEQGLPSLCIDTETGPVRLGQTAQLARLMKAEYVHTSELPQAQWAPIVEEWLAWRG